jgi:hypothetical protein
MSDLWTPSPRMLDQTVLPRSAVPRETQVDIISALGAIIADQRASNRELISCMKDMTAALGAESMYSADPSRASRARTQRKSMGGGSPGTPAGSNPAEELLLNMPGDWSPGSPSVPTGSNPAEAAAFRAAQRGGPTGADVRSESLGMLAAHAQGLRVGSYKQGKQAGWSGAKNILYNRSAQALSSMKLGGDYYEQVEVPADYDVAPGQQMDRSFLGFEEGQDTRTIYRNQMTGEVADHDTAATAMKRVMIANSIRKGAAAMGAGGGLRGGVAAAMPKMAASAGMVAGGVGVGISVAQQAYAQVVAQQDANRPFQAVLGGGNSEGYGERFRQNVFRIGNMFSANPLAGGVSEEIYKGAMDVYAGDKGMRNEAQDVMVDLYRKTGMSPSESLAIIRTAANEGNTAIQNIGQALKDVTKNARDAGMNAREARERFGEVFRTVSQSFTGAEAIAFASAQTQTQTDLGHRYQNVGFDATSQTQRMMVAAASGMTPAQVVARMQQGGGAEWYATQQAQVQQRNIAGYVASIGGSEAVARYTSQGELSAKERKDFGNELLALTGSPEAASGVLSTFGINNVAPDQAGDMLVNVLTGQTDVSGDIKANAEQYNEKDAGKLSRKDKIKLIQDLGINKMDAVEIADNKVTKKHTRKTGAAERYMRYIERTGKRSPILEKLIKDYDGSRRYTVQTGGGEKQVGTYELIDSFADQANQGTVEISKGSGSGGSIAEMLAISATGLDSYGSEAASASASYDGKNFDEEVAKNGNHSTLHIEMAPELRKFFNITATDGTTIDYAGGAQPNGTPTASQMPTGGGH